MKGWDLGNGQYSNMTPAGGSCCNASPPAKSEPEPYSFEWATELKERLDDESTRFLALRGADLIRVVSTAQPAETQTRLRDSADGIERLCKILDQYQKRLGVARSTFRELRDQIGKLNAKLEECESDRSRLLEKLDEAKSVKRARRKTAKA